MESGAAKERDASPVDVALDDVHKGISRLECVMELLEDRLRPVTRPPTGAFGQSTEACNPAPCQLVGSLDAAKIRLDELITRAESMISRLCI